MMASAKEIIEQANRGFGPLGKCHPDEPVFILRAQDAIAPEMVEKWALRARAMGVHNHKVQEAMAISQEMLEWVPRKIPD